MNKAVELADWHGFDARAAEAKRRGACAAAASRHSSSGPAPTCSRKRSASPSAVDGDGEIEIVLGDAGDGPGSRDDVCAARRRRVRRADRQDPHRSRRHRSRHGLRQRGIALAVRRRIGGARRGDAHGRESARRSPRTELEAAGSDIEYARGRVPHRRHRSSHRPVRAGGTASRSAGSSSNRPAGRRTDVAQRLPHLRSRDRSGHGKRRDRRATGRSTTSAASSIR